MNNKSGFLYIVATPIGNLEDITIRAIKILLSVDILACEDTRRTGLLLAHLKKTYPSFRQTQKDPQFVRLDEHTEKQHTPFLIDALLSGASVALVSDAGTPLVSDPGYVLVSFARRHRIPILSIPGPSAAVAALSVAGLYVNQFLFLGYLPEKQSKRKALLFECRNITKNTYIRPTLVIFVPPHRFSIILQDIVATLGDIQIVLARELTKVHEDVWHGTSYQALRELTSVKGELVLLCNVEQRATVQNAQGIEKNFSSP